MRVERGPDSTPDVALKARLSSAGLTCVVEESARSAGGRLRDIVAAHQQLLDGLAAATARFAANPARCP